MLADTLLRAATFVTTLGVAAGKVFQPIRIALTGGTVSEPVNELLFVIGKAAAIARLHAAVARG
jgi:glutamyl-tRNA synthetase